MKKINWTGMHWGATVFAVLYVVDQYFVAHPVGGMSPGVLAGIGFVLAMISKSVFHEDPSAGDSGGSGTPKAPTGPLASALGVLLLLFLVAFVACTASARSAWDKRVKVGVEFCHEVLSATTDEAKLVPVGYVRVACLAYDGVAPEAELLLESEVWNHMKAKAPPVLPPADAGRD